MANNSLGSLTLRIKAVSLTDEAKYIRRCERRLKRAKARAITRLKMDDFARLSANLSNLQAHRRVEVRREARSTHLARCLLKGTALERVEDPERTRTSPDWKRIATILSSHTGEDIRVVTQRMAEWSDQRSAK